MTDDGGTLDMETCTAVGGIMRQALVQALDTTGLATAEAPAETGGVSLSQALAMLPASDEAVTAHSAPASPEAMEMTTAAVGRILEVALSTAGQAGTGGNASMASSMGASFEGAGNDDDMTIGGMEMTTVVGGILKQAMEQVVSAGDTSMAQSLGASFNTSAGFDDRMSESMASDPTMTGMDMTQAVGAILASRRRESMAPFGNNLAAASPAAEMAVATSKMLSSASVAVAAAGGVVSPEAVDALVGSPGGMELTTAVGKILVAAAVPEGGHSDMVGLSFESALSDGDANDDDEDDGMETVTLVGSILSQAMAAAAMTPLPRSIALNASASMRKSGMTPGRLSVVGADSVLGDIDEDDRSLAEEENTMLYASPVTAFGTNTDHDDGEAGGAAIDYATAASPNDGGPLDALSLSAEDNAGVTAMDASAVPSQEDLVHASESSTQASGVSQEAVNVTAPAVAAPEAAPVATMAAPSATSTLREGVVRSLGTFLEVAEIPFLEELSTNRRMTHMPPPRDEAVPTDVGDRLRTVCVMVPELELHQFGCEQLVTITSNLAAKLGELEAKIDVIQVCAGFGCLI